MSVPDMEFVSSSNVEAIGYDPASEELHVQFAESGTYAYEGVPEWVFEELRAAPSKGSYINRMIKGTYSYHQV